MKKFLILTACAILFASVGYVMADSKGHRGSRQSRWKVDDAILSKLDLTAAQMEKVRLLRDAFKKEIAPLRSQVMEKKTELGFLWAQTRPDAARIRALEKELHELIGRIREQATAYRLTFRDLLTPEQVSKLVNLVGAGHLRHLDEKNSSRDNNKRRPKTPLP